MRIIIGFLAAALAVLLVHQPIVLVLANGGHLPPAVKAYSMAPVASALPQVAAFFKPTFGGWPSLFNSIFWGGLWGIVFSLIHPWLPGRLMILKGLVFGLLVLVLSNWIVLPLIRNQPLFNGFVPARMWPGLLILSGFGMGTGFIYSLFRRDGQA